MMTHEAADKGEEYDDKWGTCSKQFWGYSHVYWGAASADYDRDGWPDVVATSTEPLSVPFSNMR